MSKLIDKLIKENFSQQQQIGNRWYIAKPIVFNSFSKRLKDAIKVIIGKAFAVHYKADESSDDIRK